MKKYVMGFLVCLITCVMVLSSCGYSQLTNSPTTTSNMQVLGNTLVYDEYIYFANAYKDSATLSGTQNNTGNVGIESLYRVKTTKGAITYNTETNLPENVEKVLSKVVGSNNSFIYSIGEYIYFASPSTHKDINSNDTFTLNSYFRVKTDGTGLKEFYTSSTSITNQTILKIGNDYYLIMVDGTNLIKFKLGENIGAKTILASDFASAIFAKTFNTENDKFAYYTVQTKQGETVTGTYLKKVDIVTGEQTQINEPGQNDKTITLQSVFDGKLYFKMNESDSKNYYFKYETGTFSTRIAISPPVDNIEITSFNVLNQISSTTEEITTYYLYSTASKTFCLQSGNTSIDSSFDLINKASTILFTSGDYVYYSVASTGIYRISILDKIEQQISDNTNFLETKISFDGRYVYFYALNTDNTTGMYYMHRADTNNAELGQSCSVQLLGQLQTTDQPADEDE